MAQVKREGLLFAGKAIVLSVLLLAPWPFVPRALTLTFCITATTFLDAFVNDRDLTARFEPVDAAMAQAQGLDPKWTVLLASTNWKTGEKSGTALELKSFYIPFALFVALGVAAPLERRRRRHILAGGLVVLGARTLLGVAAPAERYLGLITPGSVSDVVQRVAYRALVRPPDMVYAAPILLFLLGLLVTQPVAEEAPAVAGKARPRERRRKHGVSAR